MCRAFRRRDGQLIATFRVQADLKGMETTTDGRHVTGVCQEYVLQWTTQAGFNRTVSSLTTEAE